MSADPVSEPRAVSLRGREGGATAELGGTVSPAIRAARGGGSQPYVLADEPRAMAENQRGELREANVVPSLSTGGGKPGSGYPAVRDGSIIRRLSPTERERLMGAPDGWTYDFGPSLADATNAFPQDECSPVDLTPDGRRESAAGDGVAVPCAEWIGARILLVGAR